MQDDNDEILFADEDDDDTAKPSAAAILHAGKPWKVLVVDDEPAVHSMTQLVLEDVRYRGRGIRMFSALSAAEARDVLKQHDDVACILLDVVMETDDAGLRFVREVREQMGNTRVRIILRTGQPGQAPERDVFVYFDINDYKSKTELTSQKLFTSVVAALRAYEDIMALELHRQGLQRIIEASADLFQVRNMRTFASGVLLQLSALLDVTVSGILCAQRGEPPKQRVMDEDLFVLAGSGEYEAYATGDCDYQLDPDVRLTVDRVFRDKRSIYTDDYVAIYIRSPNDREVTAYLHTGRPLSRIDESMIEVFCGKVCVGFDNIWLYDQLKRAHQATVIALADLAEYKDNETGDHVVRVEKMTERTARRLRQKGRYDDIITDQFIEQVGMASILHDVGKVGTPDNILQKPGPLDPDEWAVMQEHASNGGAILARAAAQVDGVSYLSLGAEIASGHHERWDGKGYPSQLAGQQIPLSARIVAVVDVFDALASRRPYKEPWPIEKAIDYIKAGAGSQFDPLVVEAFLEVVQEQAPEGKAEHGARLPESVF